MWSDHLRCSLNHLPRILNDDVLSSTSPLAVIAGTMSLTIRTCYADICGVIINICLVLIHALGTHKIRLGSQFLQVGDVVFYLRVVKTIFYERAQRVSTNNIVFNTSKKLWNFTLISKLEKATWSISSLVKIWKISHCVSMYFSVSHSLLYNKVWYNKTWKTLPVDGSL